MCCKLMFFANVAFIPHFWWKIPCLLAKYLLTIRICREYLQSWIMSLTSRHTLAESTRIIAYLKKVPISLSNFTTELLKYGFCNKSFRKDEPLTSWTLLLLSSLLGVIAIVFSNHAQKWGQICCKSVQLVRGSSFWNDFLQNTYFK